jgi:hypothetical protein
MAYVYNIKVTGANLATGGSLYPSANNVPVAVGQKDVSSTTLTLIGRNYSDTTTPPTVDGNSVIYGFGHYVNQNFVDLLNHGAKTHNEWTAVTANLNPGQLISVTTDARYTPARTGRLFLAGSNSNTYANLFANPQTGNSDVGQNFSHANGGLIEVYTEMNPPANMAGFAVGGAKSDISYNKATGFFVANVGHAGGNVPDIKTNILEISNTGVTLGSGATSSNLKLSNGSASISGNLSVGANVTLTTVKSNSAAGNAISVLSNTITITDAAGITTTASNLTITAYGNIAVPNTFLTSSQNLSVSAPYLDGTVAVMTTGTPANIDQPYIKSVGNLTSLAIGRIPGQIAGMKSTVYINQDTNATGEIIARGKPVYHGNGATDVTLSKTSTVDLRLRDDNGTLLTDPVGGNYIYGLIIADGGQLSNIPATAISGGGAVSNANYASYAGNITIADQPNITALGTLSKLSVNSVNDITLTGNVAITGNMTVSEKLISDVLVANTFAPDTVNAAIGIQTPKLTSGSNVTTGYLIGRWVTTDGSLINMAVNDSPLIVKSITTGNGGNTGNFYAAGAGGGWTFDNRLTLLKGLTFDDGTGNSSTLISTGDYVNLFRNTLVAVNFGTNTTSLYMGGNTAGDFVATRRDLTVGGNLTVYDSDIIIDSATANLANSTTTTLNFAGAATAINMGATTGTTTIKHNAFIAGDISANANIVTQQAVFTLDGPTTTTMNIGGNATTVSIGNTAGTTTVNNDLAVNGGDITTTATTFKVANATATTLHLGGAATAVNVGSTTGTLTVNNPTVVGTQTTQNLWNTVATTVNFAGAATTINLGKSDSTLNLRSNIIVGTSSQTTVDLWNSNATTINFGGAADDIVIGNISNVAGSTTINHGLTVTGESQFNNRASFLHLNNSVTTVNSATGTVAHNTLGSTIFYHNTPLGNFVPNFTNVSTAGDLVTEVKLIVPQGGTARVPTSVQVNGVSQTVKWLNGTAPTGNASKTDVFEFSLVYSGSTWTVLGKYSFYA